MRRPVAIRFSPFSSCLRSPKKECSRSTMMRRAGPGISIAFTPSDTPTMSWTLCSGSSPGCPSQRGLPCSRWPVSEILPRLAMLSIVLGISEEQVHADLWPAVRQELVEPQAGAYRFVHDRFQEAAYALIPEGERPAAHLRIGRLFAARTPPEAIEENVFEIVSQLNRGAALITTPAEREKLAELNLLAGRRAKVATAFAMALAHFTAGEAMLPKDRWERHYALSFALGVAPGRMRVPDRRAGDGENSPCRAGTPCGHPARSGRRHPTADGAKRSRRRGCPRLPAARRDRVVGATDVRGGRDRNTSGCGGRSVSARSRHCSTCPG